RRLGRCLPPGAHLAVDCPTLFHPFRVGASWLSRQIRKDAIPLANSEPARIGPDASPRIEQPNLTLRRQLRIRQRYRMLSCPPDWLPGVDAYPTKVACHPGHRVRRQRELTG